MVLSSSRLHPSFTDIIGDPLLLTYFTQYLQKKKSENSFRFWLELSGCLSRRKVSDESTQLASNGLEASTEYLEQLRERMSDLPVNDVTTIYFRYLSREAKLPVEIPLQLLCNTLSSVLENPMNILPLAPCLHHVERILTDELFPDFLESSEFTEFCAEIVINDQLKLDDVLFDEELLVAFIEHLAGEPTAVLVTFLQTVNAYKKEFHELVASPTHVESVDDHYRELLDDATTICAKYLSPASDDFMGLNLEQYRSVLDAACSEKEPSYTCFDQLYSIIHKIVEKNLLPPFFMSAIFHRYRAQFTSKKPG